MNPLTACTALVALLCVQILVVESQGDSGYTYPDDSKVGLNEATGDDEIRLKQLVDYITCKLFQLEDCDEATNDVGYEKRGYLKNRQRLGLMFGRRSADLAKRDGGRRKVGSRRPGKNSRNQHGIDRDTYWHALVHIPAGKRSQQTMQQLA